MYFETLFNYRTKLTILLHLLLGLGVGDNPGPVDYGPSNKQQLTAATKHLVPSGLSTLLARTPPRETHLRAGRRPVRYLAHVKQQGRKA